MSLPPQDSPPVLGELYVNVAFDWGDEIDLRHAATLAPSHEQELARRTRTPASFGYRPAPLRFPLGKTVIEHAGSASISVRIEASVFDFGGVNVRAVVELAHSFEDLRRLAGNQGLLHAIIRAAHKGAEPLYHALGPAIKFPSWQELVEEYFIFRFEPASLPAVNRLLESHTDWLAGLLRLEPHPLSAEQISDAVERKVSYAPGDLVIVDWAAAVIVDQDCEETLQTLEFANLQLLEFRLIDRRLDDSLNQAYKVIHSLAGRRGFSLARKQDRRLRVLGDIKIETESLFERAGNALKLVGDQYLSKVYRLAAVRLHLEEWSKSIHNSLDVVESVYRILSDQAAAGRIELLEVIVIVLISVEILLTLFGR
ncbi:MAG: hypothetical protein K8U03_23625 [Planctomycetia bacterium]|nr:hypothetical protein [Planctomycetia bacterium]